MWIDLEMDKYGEVSIIKWQNVDGSFLVKN